MSHLRTKKNCCKFDCNQITSKGVLNMLMFLKLWIKLRLRGHECSCFIEFSSLSILMHGVISLPEVMSYDTFILMCIA